MGNLQKMFETQIGKIPSLLIANLVREKLQAQGIKLTERQLRRLQKAVHDGKTEGLKFHHGKSTERNISIDFTEEDTSSLLSRANRFLEEGLPKVVYKVADEVAVKLLRQLKRNWPAESRAQRREIAGFRKRLEARWGSALELLRFLVTISRELGSESNVEMRVAANSKESNLIEVVTRCHARACTLVEEIICLLSAGFPDGAMARWRTLHEVAVVALFIQQHGEDIAERYVRHLAVDSYKAASEYRECQDRLGLQPISDKDFEEMRTASEAAVEHFGRNFRGDYGWAADALGKEPKFVDIERHVRLNALRTYYRMAGHSIHANPKGAFFSLGLMQETPTLLAGPSNAGLADPGHSAAISLTQVSSALVVVHPTFDNLVGLAIMAKIEPEIGKAFLKAHNKLERDERRVRRLERTGPTAANLS
jgi:Family of unknown function (DUF5677)